MSQGEAVPILSESLWRQETHLVLHFKDQPPKVSSPLWWTLTEQTEGQRTICSHLFLRDVLILTLPTPSLFDVRSDPFLRLNVHSALYAYFVTFINPLQIPSLPLVAPWRSPFWTPSRYHRSPKRFLFILSLLTVHFSSRVTILFPSCTISHILFSFPQVLPFLSWRSAWLPLKLLPAHSQPEAFVLQQSSLKSFSFSHDPSIASPFFSSLSFPDTFYLTPSILFLIHSLFTHSHYINSSFKVLLFHSWHLYSFSILSLPDAPFLDA